MTIKMILGLRRLGFALVLVDIGVCLVSIVHPFRNLVFITGPLLLLAFILLLTGGARLGFFRTRGGLRSVAPFQFEVVSKVASSKPRSITNLGVGGIIAGGAMAAYGTAQSRSERILRVNGRYVDAGNGDRVVSKHAYEVNNVISPAHLLSGGSLFIASMSLLLLNAALSETPSG